VSVPDISPAVKFPKFGNIFGFSCSSRKKRKKWGTEQLKTTQGRTR